MPSSDHLELQKRLRPGMASYPVLTGILGAYADDIVIDRDVILLGHTPSIAPKAYCHTLYPPLPPNSPVIENSGGHLPAEILLLLRMMNGARLFWSSVDLWGFRYAGDEWVQPAYDIIKENATYPRDGFIAFASTGCGDTAWLNTVTLEIELVATDNGLPTVKFRSIDEWLANEKADSDESIK